MKAAVMVAVVLALACGVAGAADLPIDLERASVAYAAPATSSGEAMTAYVLNFKVLDFESPERVTTIATAGQYLAANITLDAVIYNAEGTLPLNGQDLKMAPGVSLPLLSSEGAKTSFRAGVTYTSRTKLASYLSYGYQFGGRKL